MQGERGHPNIIPPAVRRARDEDAARIVDLSAGVPGMLTQDCGNDGRESGIASRLVKARSRKSADLVILLEEVFAKLNHEAEDGHRRCVTGPAELLERRRVGVTKGNGHVPGIAPGLRDAGLKHQSHRALGMLCGEGQRGRSATRRSYHRPVPLTAAVE